MLQIGIKCQNQGKIASNQGQMQESGYNCIKLGPHASIGEFHVNIRVMLLESGCLEFQIEIQKIFLVQLG